MKPARSRSRVGARVAVAGVVVVVAILMVVGHPRRSSQQSSEEPRSPYTASRASVIGTTGRPQLVEFFHRA